MILSHLTNQPQFKYLKQESCFSKYISLLSAKWQKAIAFMYIKNDTLFIAVTHPGFKMELHYNRDLLKSILTQLSSYDKECEMLKVDKIAIFHSKYRPVEKEEKNISTVPYYTELATASFNIENIDQDLKEKFKETKTLIEEQNK
ncbi:hypothetical protein MNB_SV-5-580 [hydrothermal vent metagenome]|uniref:DUF721 domain-containing protein n=1 Tax=hydrothermal vent metagenome TaxID=652676 RepID=A0A1W1EC74_9ZZZZ